MNRGLSFKTLPSNNTLYQILKCINIEEYVWYNIDSQNEVWESLEGSLFLEKELYDGQDFAKHILGDHFMVFAKFQAYMGDHIYYDINTYGEFSRSDCKLLLLVYDSIYVEMYVKDQTLMAAIYNNAIESNYTDIEYITNTNDHRSKMNVL